MCPALRSGLLLAALSVAASGQETTAEADRLYASGRLEEAAVIYSRFIEVYPDEPPLLLRLGGCLLAMKRYEEAVKHFSRAVKIDASLQQAQFGLGAALIEAGRGEEAIAPIEKAVELAPADRNLRRLLGRAYQEAGQWIRAEAIFRELAESDSRDAVSWFYLGLLLHENTYTQAAFDAFEKSLRADPENAKAKIYRASTLAELGRLDQAAVAFQTISSELDVRRDPEYLLGYAQLLFRRGDNSEAAALIDTALAMRPNEPKLHYWKARVFFSNHQYEQARDAAETAVRLAPVLPNSRYLLLKLYRELGLFDDAAKQAEWLKEHEQATKYGGRLR